GSAAGRSRTRGERAPRSGQGRPMSHRRWAYFAKLVPIGVPVHVPTVKGTPALTTFNESPFEAERRNPGRIPVWVNHDRTIDVGRLQRVYPEDGWWRVAFVLDDEITEELA